MKPCKVWTGAISAQGYGQVWHEGKSWNVHRLEWTRHYGEIPPGLCVLHRCDNRPCREIEHLFLGTRRDNSRDMALKRRSTIGERNPNAKLDEAAIRAIRESRESQTVLAARYGCDRSNISHIRAGRSWGRV